MIGINHWFLKNGEISTLRQHIALSRFTYLLSCRRFSAATRDGDVNTLTIVTDLLQPGDCGEYALSSMLCCVAQ